MNKIIRTDSTHPDFIALVKQLDAYLAVLNGDDGVFYAQYNKIDLLRHVVVIYDDEKAVACGAIKEIEPGTMEVKRMYTDPEKRGKGLGSQVLHALEAWAAELGYQKCVLETLKENTEANALYFKNGYEVIPNYGQYANAEKSVCFAKTLTPGVK